MRRRSGSLNSTASDSSSLSSSAPSKCRWIANTGAVWSYLAWTFSAGPLSGPDRAGQLSTERLVEPVDRLVDGHLKGSECCDYPLVKVFASSDRLLNGRLLADLVTLFGGQLSRTIGVTKTADATSGPSRVAVGCPASEKHPGYCNRSFSTGSCV